MQQMINNRNGKSHYTENEAANALGISLDDLRVLVLHRIVDTEEDLSKLSLTTFQPSDILLLRMLINQQPESASAG